MRSFWCYCSSSNRMWDMYPSISSVLPQQFHRRNPFRLLLIEWSPSGASPSSLHPPLSPFPTHECIPTKQRQIVQLWEWMRLIKCLYMLLIISCKRLCKFDPSAGMLGAKNGHLWMTLDRNWQPGCSKARDVTRPSAVMETFFFFFFFT